MFRLFVSRTTARRPRNATPQIEALEQVLSLSNLGNQLIQKIESNLGNQLIQKIESNLGNQLIQKIESNLGNQLIQKIESNLGNQLIQKIEQQPCHQGQSSDDVDVTVYGGDQYQDVY